MITNKKVTYHPLFQFLNAPGPNVLLNNIVNLNHISRRHGLLGLAKGDDYAWPAVQSMPDAGE